jgi:hypothetical protein
MAMFTALCRTLASFNLERGQNGYSVPVAASRYETARVIVIGDLLRPRGEADMSALSTGTGLQCRRGGLSRPVRGTSDSRKLASSHGASPDSGENQPMAYPQVRRPS